MDKYCICRKDIGFTSIGGYIDPVEPIVCYKCGSIMHEVSKNDFFMEMWKSYYSDKPISVFIGAMLYKLGVRRSETVNMNNDIVFGYGRLNRN